MLSILPKSKLAKDHMFFHRNISDVKAISDTYTNTSTYKIVCKEQQFMRIPGEIINWTLTSEAALSGHQPGSPNDATVREVAQHRPPVATPNATAGGANLPPNPRLAQLPLDPRPLPTTDHCALDQAAPTVQQLGQAFAIKYVVTKY